MRADNIPAHTVLSDQVKESIIEIIRASDGSSNKLPPESELAKLLGVSVAVVREALLLLREDGIVTKKHGAGNYFHKTALERRQYMDRMPGYAAILQAQGYKPTSGMAHLEELVPPEEVRQKLGLEEGETTFFFSRTIYVDGVPAVYGNNWLPAKLFRTYLEDSDTFFSLFNIIRLCIQQDVAYGDMEFIPRVAGAEDAAELGVALNSAIMIMEEVYYSLEDKPLAYSYDKLNTKYIRVKMISR